MIISIIEESNANSGDGKARDEDNLVDKVDDEVERRE